MPRLHDKIAIITGAASGIGYESAVLFSQKGAKVVCCDVNFEGAQKTVSQINALLNNTSAPDEFAFAVQADISKEDQVKSLVDKTIQKFGRLDIMFNNAGIMHPDDSDAINTDEKIWNLTMDINVKGVWYGCKYAIQEMLKNKEGGSIINTASFVAKLGAATPQLAYTASKGAVLSMSRELAILHAKDNIRINALCPGPLKTPLLMDFLNTDEKLNRRLTHIPVGRFGEAIELAYAALFLASKESSFVTGTDFLVDGGITAAYVTAEGQTKSFAQFKSYKEH